MKKLTQKELDGVLELHKKWLNNEEDGERAILNYTDLSGLNLNDAKLNGAYLNGAELNDAQLNGAKLNYAQLNYAKLNNAELNDAQLNGAQLNYAKLNGAELNDAKLNGAELNDAKLNCAKLNNAELDYAELIDAQLNYAKLNNAKLNGAKLNNAELNNAELNYAKLNCAKLNNADFNNIEFNCIDLRNVNLSQIKNSPFFNQYKWMCENFKKDSEGFFVFKRIGNTEYNSPESWKIESGKYIEDNPNMNRTENCGCGVNFGNKKYIKYNYTSSNIWLCKLYFEDAYELCVPIHTDGKARCGRLQLLRIISEEEMKNY